MKKEEAIEYYSKRVKLYKDIFSHTIDTEKDKLYRSEVKYKLEMSEIALQALISEVEKPKLDIKPDFEGFLMDKHGEDYIGTDDMMPDAFNNWVQDLEVDDFINYGNEYVKKFIGGKR